MDIGQRLKQARLAAGLSQRQLCGDVITRNMLSQIENGTANPSMDTLRYLAGALGKSVSYFLEEEGGDGNALLLGRCRDVFAKKEYALCLELLEQYDETDASHKEEKYLLEALCLTALAERAAAEGKNPYAMSLLDRADTAGASTLYDTEDCKRRRLLLYLEITGDPAVAERLPDIQRELVARGAVCLRRQDAEGCLAYLAAVDTPKAQLLKGDAYLLLENYAGAKDAFHKAEAAFPREVISRLEQCYRELGDFKMAYFYACKGR